MRGSKELVEIGPRNAPARSVIDWALRRVRAAGVRRAAVVTTEDKHDLRRALSTAEGRDDWPRTQAVFTPCTPSSVHTVAAAMDQEPEAQWLLVFPDILTAPPSAARALVHHAARSTADVSLCLVPSDRPEKADMVEIDENSRLLGLAIKQPDQGLRFTWVYACWQPTFTALLERELRRPSRRTDADSELFFGHVLLAALDAGLVIDTISFEDGFALDIGTPDDLRRAREEPDPRFFG